MIRLNSSIQLRDSSDQEKLNDLLVRLCEISMRERGMIDYNAYSSLVYSDRFMISGTFRDHKAFEQHAASTAELKKEVEEIATLTYEVFNF